MSLLSRVLIGLNGLIHSYICWMEMFAWETRGPRVFSTFPPELFAQTTEMAANQGLYNAFLAAGLFWSLTISTAEWAQKIAAFFLICVVVAGLYGAVTVMPQILIVQTIPAGAAVIALLWGSRKSLT